MHTQCFDLQYNCQWNTWTSTSLDCLISQNILWWGPHLKRQGYCWCHVCRQKSYPELNSTSSLVHNATTAQVMSVSFTVWPWDAPFIYVMTWALVESIITFQFVLQSRCNCEEDEPRSWPRLQTTWDCGRCSQVYQQGHCWSHWWARIDHENSVHMFWRFSVVI